MGRGKRECGFAGYAAVREYRVDGTHFIDENTISCNPEHVSPKVKRQNYDLGKIWVMENPVIRIVKIEVKEVLQE